MERPKGHFTVERVSYGIDLKGFPTAQILESYQNREDDIHGF